MTHCLKKVFIRRNINYLLQRICFYIGQEPYSFYFKFKNYKQIDRHTIFDENILYGLYKMMFILKGFVKLYDYFVIHG